LHRKAIDIIVCAASQLDAMGRIDVARAKGMPNGMASWLPIILFPKIGMDVSWSSPASFGIS